MASSWQYQAQRLKQMIDANNITHAHLYMEQLMLFPVDVQDKIIEDISQLPYCNSEAIAQILGQYSMMSLR